VERGTLAVARERANRETRAIDGGDVGSNRGVAPDSMNLDFLW